MGFSGFFDGEGVISEGKWPVECGDRTQSAGGLEEEE